LRFEELGRLPPRAWATGTNALTKKLSFFLFCTVSGGSFERSSSMSCLAWSIVLVSSASRCLYFIPAVSDVSLVGMDSWLGIC